eukprot:scaffold204329_cov47-Prasinocladus_malaysianus.AAC.1
MVPSSVASGRTAPPAQPTASGRRAVKAGVSSRSGRGFSRLLTQGGKSAGGLQGVPQIKGEGPVQSLQDHPQLASAILTASKLSRILQDQPQLALAIHHNIE